MSYNIGDRVTFILMNEMPRIGTITGRVRYPNEWYDYEDPYIYDITDDDGHLYHAYEGSSDIVIDAKYYNERLRSYLDVHKRKVGLLESQIKEEMVIVKEITNILNKAEDESIKEIVW